MTGFPGRLRSHVVAGCAVLALLAVVWTAGFAWFIHAAWRRPELPQLQADGIVALTGGADRIETALHLLSEGRGRILLVSGVGGPTDFANLARRAGIDAALRTRVTLGRLAASTRGNARETADWAQANNVHSLLVVTAGYHMPRALSELARALPSVVLRPVPVLSPGMRGKLPLRLLVGEYSKYLVAASGLSGWADLIVFNGDVEVTAASAEAARRRVAGG